MQVEAAYYDGRTARRHEVRLSVASGWLELQGDAEDRREPLASLNIPAPLGNTPRLILFPDGARCEIADHVGFTALLGSAGYSPLLMSRLEAQWRHAFAALVVTLGVLVAAYLWGLPLIAEKIAAQVPQRVLGVMDSQFFNAFDGRFLHPSKLGSERQQALTRKFMSMELPLGSTRPSRILFRSSPEIGPNAFALPGGTVVVLDELAKLSDNDDEILAVLAHEMGHVSERHALRQMLQASVVGLAMTWYVGDVSSLLAAAPTALLQTRYSRDFERQADAFGARMLMLNHISPALLADMLSKLEGAHGAGKPSKHAGMDYLSTHPATDERIRTLRNFH